MHLLLHNFHKFKILECKRVRNVNLNDDTQLEKLGKDLVEMNASNLMSKVPIYLITSPSDFPDKVPQEAKDAVVRGHFVTAIRIKSDYCIISKKMHLHDIGELEAVAVALVGWKVIPCRVEFYCEGHPPFFPDSFKGC